MARWINVYADPGTQETMNDFIAITDGLDSTFDWDEPDDCDMRSDDEAFFYLYVTADSRESEISLEMFCRSHGYDIDEWEETDE